MKITLNPLALLNIISGHLHRNNVLGAVEMLKDLPWDETEKNTAVTHYEIPELEAKRSVSGGFDTLMVQLQDYTFTVSERDNEKMIRVSSHNGYKMVKRF